ncbi:MAG: endonuclease [Alphaproteobacteria bacterium]|nr:endonuclease [Alphaproteobacteria bacterium]
MQISLALDADPKLPRIRDLLIAVHGPQRDALRHDPTSQFIKAMLSSHTFDSISDAAYLELHARLPSWDALADFDPADLAAVVPDVTHTSNKAIHLVTSARIIIARRGRLDLAFLARRSVEHAMAWLLPLPGVGWKVAAVTVNFSTLRMRALVVDRHVLRASRCMGLLPPTADFTRGFHMLMRLVPDNWDADDLYELHWLMKKQSQTTCSHPHIARDSCPLGRFCGVVMVQDRSLRNLHQPMH